MYCMYPVNCRRPGRGPTRSIICKALSLPLFAILICASGPVQAQEGGGVQAVAISDTFSVLVEGPNTNCAAGMDCRRLITGFADGATDGVDVALSEVEIPPLPVSDVFDARLIVAGIEGLWMDLRDPTATSSVWKIAVQAGLGGYPLTLTWDSAALPASAAGTWTMRDTLAGNTVVNVDMTTTGSLVITNTEIKAVTISLVSGSTGPETVPVTYGAGWNMVSLPVVPTDATYNVLFPDAAGAGVFRYAGGYQSVTTLQPCEGYWLKLNTGDTYSLTGTTVDQCDTLAPSGWNILGVPVDGVIRSNMIETPTSNVASVFGYAGGYIQKNAPDLLENGQGFWFKLNTGGQLVMNSEPGGVTPKVAGALGEGSALPTSRLTASVDGRQQTLLLGADMNEISELPPLPPAGLLDLRASIGGVSTDGVPLPLEQTEYPLSVQGAPSLGWDMQSTASSQWQLIVDGETHSLVGRGSVRLASSSDVRLLFTPSPQRFSLSANYPNPFNPATTIRYELQDDGPTSLVVYDVTGQLVRTLVNGEQPAGSHVITWDGHNAAGSQVGAGVYLYELRSGSSRSIQKMMLMK
jgi:hypothetical protein